MKLNSLFFCLSLAVLFLEFWKRAENRLQYTWHTLGFEETGQRERPKFIQAIKNQIKDYPEEKKKLFKVFNPVLERYEFIQPKQYYIPKILLSTSVVLTMVAAAVGVVLGVLVYRLAVSTAIYRLIQNYPGGPSIADVTVSISGSVIQIMFIIIMNLIYKKLATWFTSWGKILMQSIDSFYSIFRIASYYH